MTSLWRWNTRWAARVCALLGLIVVISQQFPRLAEASTPTNDNRADATSITSLPFEDSLSTQSATDEAEEPEMCAGGGKTVWYRYEADADRTIIADTFGSDFDTVLAAYQQSSTGDLVAIACNDDTNGLDSRVSFASLPGVVYYLQVGGFSGSSGDGVLHVDTSSSITGTITNEAGDPIRGICADAVTADANGSFVSRAYTNEFGYYLVSVPAGSYKVYFSSCWDNAYRSEWYNDKLDQASAEEVIVSSGRATRGIDAALTLLGSISGRITSGGHPISTCVSVTDLEGNQKSWDYSNGDGTYSARGLVTGSYKVRFGGCQNNSPYRSEWFNDKPDLGSADAVSVTQGEEAAGIDADLMKEPPPANDDRASAVPVSSLPFTDTRNISAATEELAEPNTTCGRSYNTVWYTLSVETEKTVVVQTFGSVPLLGAVYSRGVAGELVEKQCGPGGGTSSGATLGFTARPGTVYYLQVGTTSSNHTGEIWFNVQETELKQPHLFTTTSSCAVACPYWSSPTDHPLERERACAPTPDSSAGTWSDLTITVPGAAADGRVPSHLVFSINPSHDYDSFVCRASPDANGKYFVATGANSINETCPTLAIFGCEEDVLVRVNPGESYVLRVYNWLDTVGSVGGSYSFRLMSPPPSPGPHPGGGVIISTP